MSRSAELAQVRCRLVSIASAGATGVGAGVGCVDHALDVGRPASPAAAHERAPRIRLGVAQERLGGVAVQARGRCRRVAVDHQAGHQQPQLPERGQAELVQLRRDSNAPRATIRRTSRAARRASALEVRRVSSVSMASSRPSRASASSRASSRDSSSGAPHGGHGSASGERRQRGELRAASRTPLARAGRRARASSISDAHAEARRALPTYGRSEAPRGARDVHVHPRHVADERLQELRGGDRGGLARLGRVVEVGVLALDQLRVLLVQRQPPADLAGGGAGGVDLGAPVVVVGEQAGSGSSRAPR